MQHKSYCIGCFNIAGEIGHDKIEISFIGFGYFPGQTVPFPHQNAENESNSENSRVLYWYEKWMSLKKGRTYDLYLCTLNRLKAFLGEEKLSCLQFEEISRRWILEFNHFLANTALSPNTRAIHLRNLRAVFNYAISNEATSCYPFRHFRIKTVKTRKRNYDIDTLRKIFNYKCEEAWLQRYLDAFKLSFMLMGINIVDLCHLKEVNGGRVQYVRSKTGRHYDIKVEPEIRELLEKYKGEKYLLDYLDHCKHYRYFYFNLCRSLRIIKKRLKIKEMTTYWARHTWATIASGLDVPKDTIAAALGHGADTVTDIYIEFDLSKIDRANRMVLDYVLKPG